MDSNNVVTHARYDSGWGNINDTIMKAIYSCTVRELRGEKISVSFVEAFVSNPENFKEFSVLFENNTVTITKVLK